jgi:hypothetical protein
MPTISYIKPPLAIIDPSKPQPAPKVENLEAAINIIMQGAVTVVIEAPEDDQLLFTLVPEAERNETLLSKIWVKSTIQGLQQTVNQMFEQTIMKTRLYPTVRTIRTGFDIGPDGRLVYMFQVPVTNFPPQQLATPTTVSDAPVSAMDTPIPANDALDVLNPVL